ncbi:MULTISPECIES: helix-turn-helix domain-containing protein [unclassified Carboxylicivirga]|uniref:helix-turn-helix domain-containing protein n=1 Tax=Carboxylicivirga TaxID=1628153 RepID=UPI003D325240
MNILGKRLRELREEKGLLLRQIAADLEVDTALMSKLERGERRAQREHITQLSSILNVQEKELVILWLADKIKDLVRNEPLALEALKFVEHDIKGNR